MTGSHEVRGSIPLISTKGLVYTRPFVISNKHFWVQLSTLLMALALGFASRAENFYATFSPESTNYSSWIQNLVVRVFPHSSNETPPTALSPRRRSFPPPKPSSTKQVEAKNTIGKKDLFTFS